MKNKRWLFILLGILFLINISFFVITRYARYDRWLIDYLTAFVEEQFDASTTVRNLRITDTQLHLSDVVLADNNGVYRIEVSHIYVNYNLLKVIFSNIKLSKAVESISIIEPKISVRLDNLTTKQSGTQTDGVPSLSEIPDFSDYFRMLNVVDGSISIEYLSEHITYRDSFLDLEMNIANDRTSSINLNLRREKRKITAEENIGEISKTLPVLSVEMEADKGKLLSLHTILQNYHPMELNLRDIGDIDFLVYLEGTYLEGIFHAEGIISDLQAFYGDRGITAETIDLFSYDDRWLIQTDNLFIDGNQTRVDIDLRDIISRPHFDATLVSEQIPMEKYLPQIRGRFDLRGRLSGNFDNPSGTLRAESEHIHLYGENIEDVKIEADYTENQVTIYLQHALWQDNILSGEGVYSVEEGLFLSMKEPGLSFRYNDFDFRTDLQAELFLREDLEVQAILDSLDISNERFSLAGLSLRGRMANDDIDIDVSGERFNLSAWGNYRDEELYALLRLQGFNTNNLIKNRTRLLNSYPHLNGDIEISYLNKLFHLHTALRMYNLQFGELEGNIRSYLEIDFLNDRSLFSLETIHASYRYEPISILLQGEGTTDSLDIDTFHINDDLKANLSLKINPSPSFSFNLSGENVEFQRYLHYFITPYTANHFGGKIDLDIELDFPHTISGRARGSGISYKKLGPYNNELVFNLINSQDGNQKSFRDGVVEVSNRLSNLQDDVLAFATGIVQLNNDLDIDITAYLDSLSLQELMPEIELQGLVDSEWYYRRAARENEIGFHLQASSVSYQGLRLDSLRAEARQQDQILYIDEFQARGDDLFTASIEGTLGYNLITNRFYSGDDQVDLHFRGDLIKILAHNFDFLEEGNSVTELELHFGIRQDELSVMSGHFTLEGENLKVLNQPVRAEDIHIALQFADNRLSVEKFESRIGEGRILVRNEIRENEYDFEIGMLKLGHFYSHTTDNGITIHIPSYFPHNSVGNVVVRGRDSEEAEIRGPFDDMFIIADLYLSNASVTYPRDTENLFKLINVAAERRRRLDPQPLPFELDLNLIARNQVRYVTYPLNLLLLPDSYIRLLYQDTEWIPADAFFSSESGSLDMFGTTFNLDYADFYINHDLNDYRFKGTFFRYAADGSLITLEVYNETNGDPKEILQNMKFELESDNPEDRTTLHVLSKLRYNRRLEDIPRSQQNALMQDEFLQLAGMGLAGAIVDPLIFPLANRARQFFKVDYFSIRPSLIENLVQTYGFNEQGREPQEENEIIQFGKNILLNNLSINIGKFLSRDLYTDYEFLLQRPVDVVGQRDLLVYHNFTFHYTLPLHLRLSYRFYLKPEEERNSHEVFIRRSFSFW